MYKLKGLLFLSAFLWCLVGVAQIRETPAEEPKKNSSKPSSSSRPVSRATLLVTWKGDATVNLKIGGDINPMAPGQTKEFTVEANQTHVITVSLPGKSYSVPEYFIAEPGAGHVEIWLQQVQRNNAYETVAAYKYQSQRERDEIRRQEEEKREKEQREREAQARESQEYANITSSWNRIDRDPFADYNQIVQLRKAVASYLRDFSTYGRNGVHYNEVSNISSRLGEMPKSQSEFNTGKAEWERNAEQRKLAEEERKRQEAERIRVAQEQERERQRQLEAQRAAEALRAAEEARRIDREQGTIFGVMFGSVARYGIFIDALEYRTIGVSFSIRSSLRGDQDPGDSYFESTTTDPNGTNYVPTPIFHQGKTVGSLGITIPIVHPVSLYLTGGIGGITMFQEFREYDGTEYVKNITIKSSLPVVPLFDSSFGVICKVGNFMGVKTGVSLTNLGSPEFTFGAGFNIR